MGKYKRCVVLVAGLLIVATGVGYGSERQDESVVSAVVGDATVEETSQYLSVNNNRAVVDVKGELARVRFSIESMKPGIEAKNEELQKPEVKEKRKKYWNMISELPTVPEFGTFGSEDELGRFVDAIKSKFEGLKDVEFDKGLALIQAYHEKLDKSTLQQVREKVLRESENII
jgi:hypothetical protein